MAIYVTPAGLPRGLRCFCEVWIPLAFLRSTKVKIAIGTWTSMFRALLDNALVGPNSIADYGVPIQICDDEPPNLVFFNKCNWHSTFWLASFCMIH